MATNFFANGMDKFYYHKKAENETGEESGILYNYYGRIHSTGRVLIMREEVISGNVRYADGSHDFDTAWTNRTTLTYKNIDLL